MAEPTQPRRLEWTEQRRGESFDIIAELTNGKWEFRERNTGEARWWPVAATTELLARADLELASTTPDPHRMQPDLIESRGRPPGRTIDVNIKVPAIKLDPEVSDAISARLRSGETIRDAANALLRQALGLPQNPPRIADRGVSSAGRSESR